MTSEVAATLGRARPLRMFPKTAERSGDLARAVFARAHGVRHDR